MMIDGTDYTIPALCLLAVLLFFTVQYLLCRKAKRLAVKMIPFYGVGLLLLAAIGVLNTDNRGSFIDLRGLLAMLIAGFALLCALAAGAAWLLHWLRHRK